MGTQLLAHHGITDAIAFGDRGERSKLDLLRDAARIAHALPESEADSGVELVFQGDRYLLAAALLGALYRGHAVHLPASHQRDTVMSVMQAASPVAVLHDTTVGAPTRVDLLLAEPSCASEARPLEGGTIAGLVHFHAEDGSVHTRGWNSLLSEARSLAAFLDLSPRSHVLSTVPPSRALGLVVSVLVPLVSGAAMCRQIFPSCQSLKALLERESAATLVTSPHVLQGLLAQSGRVPGLRQVALTPGVSTSRGQLLSRLPASTHVMEVVTAPSFAVVGQRDGRVQGPYEALSGVELGLDDDGVLSVSAPYMDEPCNTQRVAELLDAGRFNDVGHRQDILRQGAQSISLPALKTALLHSTNVQDAALCLVQQSPAHSPRVLCAVVATVEQEKAAFETLSRALDGLDCELQTLRVDRLPMSEDGTSKAVDVLRLFGLGKSGRPPNYSVEWGAFETLAAGENYRVEARLPQDSAFFDGHFPGYPILPAAAQLSALIVPAVRRAVPEVGYLKRMLRLKFLGRIRPGDTVEIVLRRNPGSQTFQFQLSRDGKTCAVGTLEFSDRGT